MALEAAEKRNQLPETEDDRRLLLEYCRSELCRTRINESVLQRRIRELELMAQTPPKQSL